MFLDLLTEEDDDILSAGQWSERGCNRSENLSNTSVTVCECNHLTHFAIFLSAAPLNLTDSATPTTMGTTDAATPITIGTTKAPDKVLAVVEADVLKKVSYSVSLLYSVTVIFPQIMNDSQLNNISASVSIIIINSV